MHEDESEGLDLTDHSLTFLSQFIGFLQRIALGLTSSALYGLALGSVAFLILKGFGFDSNFFGINRETYWFMLCIPGMALTRLLTATKWAARRRLRHLKDMHAEKLIPKSVYDEQVRRYAEWYMTMDIGVKNSPINPQSKKKGTPSQTPPAPQ
jgi:hypothetical protein